MIEKVNSHIKYNSYRNSKLYECSQLAKFASKVYESEAR